MDESMMEELSTEEKAQRYDEAIKNAKDIYTYECDDAEQLRKIERIFPELKEIKDLEDAANNALSNVLNTHEIVNIRSCLEMFKAGAEWQNQKRWKPSEEQMQALKEACDKRWEPDRLDPLYTLWEQLKNL